MTEISDAERGQILDLLQQEEVERKYLDIGFSEEHDIFWYGFKLGGKDAIVTSDGRVLRNTEETFKEKIIGENQIAGIFEYDGTIGDIAPRISRAAVKRFITKEPETKLVNPKELYRKLWNIHVFYMDYGDDQIADAKVLWEMGTYCYPLFSWFPHMINNAPSESGKSKDLYLVTHLSFGGYDLGASAGVTPAQIYRTVEDNRGMICMDEYEQIDSDTLKIVNQILNSSAARDAYIIRSEQIDKKWVAKRFPIFCPKAVGNISGINAVSLSRFILFSWLKTASAKGQRKPDREKDRKQFPPLRDDLHIMLLENWQSIKQIYESLDVPKLTNRQRDNWLPLIAIARFIDSCPGELVNAEKHLMEYIDTCKEIQVETNDNTADFFSLLSAFVSDKPKYYTPKEIAEYQEIAELLSYLKGPAWWIGRKLSAYKFEKNRSGGINRYLLSKEKVQAIIELYFPNITTHNDTNNTNNTNNT